MMTNFLKSFFKELHSMNIKYCVLRNYEQLPVSLGGSDLDILIDIKDKEKFYKLLNNILDQNHGKIIIQYGKLTPRICIAGINGSVPYGLQLDVHEGILPYKTSNMFPIKFLFSRKQIYNNIFVVKKDDANLIAFLKEIFNNGICKKEYFENAKESWNKNKFFYKEPLKDIYNDEFIKNLDAIFENAYDQNEISKLAKEGRSLLTQGFNIKLNNFKSKISRLYRFLNPPGFTIAMLGTDGSGKTTIIKAISPALNEAVHNALYYEHMRPNLIPNIAQLFGKNRQEGPVTNPHGSKPSGSLGSLLRLFYYSFDYIFGYWFKVYPVIVKKSSIWIFDRYYYDYFFDPKRARISLPEWVIKIVGIVIPKPNLILCFGADPKVIFDRKPELSLEEINRQINKLKKFCDANANAFWIDTGNSIDISTKEAFNKIIEKMNERY